MSSKKNSTTEKATEKATEKNGGKDKASNGSKLTPNMEKVLGALSKVKEPVTAAKLVELTGIVKGKRLPELVEAGLIKVLVPEEGKRGQRYQVTPAGRKALGGK